MMRNEDIPDYVLDLKKLRNAIYAVGDGTNPYERKQLWKEACEVAYNVTEKWKTRNK